MKKLAVLTAAAAVLSCCAFGMAEDKPAAAPPPPDAAKFMEAMQKNMVVGAQHRQLKAMEGSFKADVKFRMDPNGPEQTSAGTAKNEMIMGGRFLKSDYTGDMMGMPFKGLQIIGYDNATSQYQCAWLDEMSTGMFFSQGSADASGKVITLTCKFQCPVTNGPKTMKLVFNIKGDDEHTLEMYDVQPGGEEVRGMTITYTRVKS